MASNNGEVKQYSSASSTPLQKNSHGVAVDRNRSSSFSKQYEPVLGTAAAMTKEDVVLQEVKKQKKKNLELAIPDEEASLNGRLSQMKDSVGPRSSRHQGHPKQKHGIWGDESCNASN